MQWIAAEKATRGFLLSRDGVRSGIDPRSLWGGTVARARRYASEELKRWWTEHPRKAFTEFRAQLLGRDRDVQAATRARGRGNDRDFRAMSQPTRVERFRAMRAARFAAERGLLATACPYDPYSPNPAVRILALAWVRVYLRRRPTPSDAIDFTG